ncbi:phosphate/phosphite/phosphonate ABC transporter substrate-binding protein [Clostridium sp. 19966]|uniref:phosphate/phosphite/phosphonate ABC transporter substrate-binding protein n=1 Tax=Clostridium sp. 19966 TaxID=2768166 RepID=UPI0028DDCDA7|nr:phosphate/phosphite/phosphonate ABC transporter substrate-binding protein [Clostridium sp. 19966]MDT8717198.1 phosphate/phosphite/phosphonate ABC transporter substrate-binding protein [Clostridium sp. 19966]
MKKAFIMGLSAVLAVSVLAGCSSKKSGDSSKQSYVPKTLTVQFVPSSNAETLEAKAKPLEKLLGDKLGIPVKVSVSTNYNTIIEAMASKKVDVGFLPPSAYVLAKQKNAAELLLQAQRYGIKQPTGENTTELVDSYRSMIVVKKGSSIKSLQDLKGKKIAWQDVTSSAGYIWPAAEMKKAGIDPEKDVQGTIVKGHDKGILAVLNGDVDAAAVFEDARNVVKKDYPDIFNQVEPIYFTKGIPNDTISVRPDMDKTWKDKIQQAFLDVAKDPEGKKVINDVYTHAGYVKTDDSKFDIVREYQKLVEK